MKKIGVGALISVLLLMLVSVNDLYAGKKITLRYMSWFTGESGKVEKEVLDIWRAKHPNIELKKVRTPGVYTSYQDKLFTMIAGGNPPDIATLDTWWSQRFYERGVCVNLDPLIERDKVDLSLFRPGFVEEGRSVYDGHMYGLVWGPGVVLTFFNQDAFDKAGLPYPKKGWTVKDLLTYGKKLTKDFNGDGIIDQWGFRGGDWPEGWCAYLWGGRWFNEKGELSITDPKFVKGVQFGADLTLKYGIQPTMAQEESISKVGVWRTGKIAMWISWDGFVGWDRRAGIKFREYTTYLPRADNNPIITFQKGNSIVILKGTKHLEEAWDFVKWLSLSDEAQFAWARMWAYPTTTKAARSPEFLNAPGAPNILYPSAYPTKTIVRLPYDVPGWTEAYNKLFVPERELVFLGKETAEEAMAKIEPEFKKILREAKQRVEKIKRGEL